MQEFYLPLLKGMVGFDDAFNKFSKDLTQNGYPPHNVIKIDENLYQIEMAIAGFAENEIDIIHQDRQIIITGNPKDKNELNYLYRGIGRRSFQKVFALDEFIQVKDANIVDGMLIINVERFIPEDRKPKKILIGKS